MESNDTLLTATQTSMNTVDLSGLTGGAKLLQDINQNNSNVSNVTVAGDFLLFTADDGITGNELWVSDGTADGTQLLKDINISDSPDGDYPASSNASNFTEFDGKLLFTANNGITGNELWVSDGTADGTQLLKDIDISNSPDGDYPAGSSASRVSARKLSL